MWKVAVLKLLACKFEIDYELLVLLWDVSKTVQTRCIERVYTASERLRITMKVRRVDSIPLSVSPTI
jgi:hypothetical protein